jgi:hypothetical protein
VKRLLPVNGTKWYQLLIKDGVVEGITKKQDLATLIHFRKTAIKDASQSINIVWNHLGWAVCLNALGIRPPENQRLTTEISSRGRHTHGEETYR